MTSLPPKIQADSGKPELEALQRHIGYRFSQPELLIQALTHKSYAHENQLTDNERFEFLGDAILQFIISDILMRKYPALPEGMLSKFRAVLVSENGLRQLAETIKLGQYLFIGKGEESTGGRQKSSILSDALEALLAAVFLDSRSCCGITAITRIIENLFAEEIKKAENIYTSIDYKTDLQEFVQKNKLGTLRYEIIGESGPDHNKEFVTALLVANEIFGIGRGKSKKTAEQAAAINAIEKLKSKNDD